MFDLLLRKMEEELRAGLDATVTSFVATARAQLEGAAADVAKERAKGLADIAKKHAEGLADVAEKRAALKREIAAMQKQQEAQDAKEDALLKEVAAMHTEQTIKEVELRELISKLMKSLGHAD